MSGIDGRSPPVLVGPVLYVASRFPVLSETFVHREVEAVRAEGVDVAVATLRPPPDDPATQSLCERLGPAVPVYGPGFVSLAMAVCAELGAHPFRTLRTVVSAARDLVTATDVGLRGRAVVPLQAAAGLALARRVRSRGIRHVHAHMANAPTTVAMYAAMQLGVPFSFTGHANDLFVGRCLLREKLERAAFVACISEWNRGFFRSIGDLALARMPIVRCGVDVAPERDARSGGATVRVVAVGRLVEKKGFAVLLDAFAILTARGSPMQVEIIGDGPELQRLEAQAARLARPGAVRFAGALPHADVLARIRAADVFVLPCIVDRSGDRDGIPVVLMEAMAAGLAVVSGDLPSIRELVEDGTSGRLVAPGDAAALADAMDALTNDPAARARLGRAARARVAEEFSTPVNTQRLLAAFAAAGASAA